MTSTRSHITPWCNPPTILHMFFLWLFASLAKFQITVSERVHSLIASSEVCTISVREA